MAGTPNLIQDGPSIFAHAYNTYKETDGGLWVPASQFDYPDGTWTLVRTAAGQVVTRKTAAADTTHIIVNLNSLAQKIGQPGSTAWDPIVAGQPNVAGRGQGHDIRGFELTGFVVVYTLTVANLTSFTPLFWRNDYPAGIASPPPVPFNPVPAPGLLSPAVLDPNFDAVNIKSIQVTFPPFTVYDNIPYCQDTLELIAIDAGTSVLDLYGVFFWMNYNNL